jgi:phosphoribosylglycinamide formyltransferase-1
VNIGALASHEGTTLQAVLDACANGDIDGQVTLVISNNADSGALRRARAAGAPVANLSGKTHPDPAELDRAIRDALAAAGADIVLLAGYMKKLGPLTLGTYAGRIINTHPSLLPKHGGQGMYGMHVHRAVIAAGDSVSGVTVHHVEDDYDTGPALAQCRVAVMPADTPESLAQRVQASERQMIVKVLGKLSRGEPIPPPAASE